jgi:hypothetical protein
MVFRRDLLSFGSLVLASSPQPGEHTTPIPPFPLTGKESCAALAGTRTVPPLSGGRASVGVV